MVANVNKFQSRNCCWSNKCSKSSTKYTNNVSKEGTADHKERNSTT
jgi:hypothetical protein